MKKMLFLALLTIVLGSATYAREFVAEGKTFSALGDYRIEKADNPVIINGEEFKAYEISYQNTPMKVTIVIKKGKDCKNYIVLSEKLAIQYVCNENYFGVEKLDKSLVVEGFKPTEAGLNRSEYFHQKKLASGMRGELENTQLIAAYFPLLLMNS
jgi:hypothetical protein